MINQPTGLTDPQRIYQGGVDGASIELSFPFLAWDEPNRLAVMIFKDGQDGVTTTSSVLLGVSRDSGVTWSPPSTVVVGASPCPVGPAGVTVLPDGRWFVTYSKYVGGAPATYTMWSTYSSDQGATWSTPVQITSPGYTGYVVAAAPVTVLSSGDFVLPVYGANTTGNNFVTIMASTDDGVTWAARASLAGAVVVDIQEPMLWEVSAGNLVLLTRGTDHQARRWTSSDFGATWSAPAVAWTNTNSIVKALKMTSGRWLVLDRAQADGACYVRHSDDDLATFSAAQLVVGPDMRTTYEDLVEVQSGIALLVYGAELWGPTGVVLPQGDIWRRYLTDGPAVTPDGQSTAIQSRCLASAGALLAWDTFCRPDNSYGVGAMDSGHRWWCLTAGGTAFGLMLTGSRAQAQVGQSTDAYAEMGTADVDLVGEFTWAAGTTTGFGIMFRFAADTSHLAALITTSGGHIILYSVSAAGVYTVITDVPLTLAAVAGKWTKVRVRAAGSHVKVYVDDDLLIQATTTVNQTATKHGIHLSNNGTNQQSCRRFAARAA